MTPSAERTLARHPAVSSPSCSAGLPSANAIFLSARLISSTSRSPCDARAVSRVHRVALSRRPGGVTLPRIANSLVAMIPLSCNAPRDASIIVRARFTLGDFTAHDRNQLAAIVDSVVERVEPANQKRRHAEVVVCQHRFGDLPGSANQ